MEMWKKNFIFQKLNIIKKKTSFYACIKII